MTTAGEAKAVNEVSTLASLHPLRDGWITSGEIIEFLDSLNAEIKSRQDAGWIVGWMMHDKILTLIRKLKDRNGYYLLECLDMELLDYPVVINQEMDSEIKTDRPVMKLVRIADTCSRRDSE